MRHDGRWNLIGFRDLEDGSFVGELTDPIPVTSVAGTGLVPDPVPRPTRSGRRWPKRAPIS